MLSTCTGGLQRQEEGRVSTGTPNPREKVFGDERHLFLPPPADSQWDKPPQAGGSSTLDSTPKWSDSQSFLEKASCLETHQSTGANYGWSQGGLEAGGALGQVPSHPSLTLDVLGVVNDKVPIPDHRQVDRQVTDVISFVEILQEETEGGRAC